MESESNQVKTVIIDNGFKYTKYYTTKAGVNCWRCTTKNCTARITTVTDDTEYFIILSCALNMFLVALSRFCHDICCAFALLFCGFVKILTYLLKSIDKILIQCSEFTLF